MSSLLCKPRYAGPNEVILSLLEEQFNAVSFVAALELTEKYAAKGALESAAWSAIESPAAHLSWSPDSCSGRSVCGF